MSTTKQQLVLHHSVGRHETAVNLARRYTIQNENDLMQEDIYDNTMDHVFVPTTKVVMDRSYCENLAHHLMHVKDLPKLCQTPDNRDLVQELQRRDTDTTHPTQFLS